MASGLEDLGQVWPVLRSEAEPLEQSPRACFRQASGCSLMCAPLSSWGGHQLYHCKLSTLLRVHGSCIAAAFGLLQPELIYLCWTYWHACGDVHPRPKSVVWLPKGTSRLLLVTCCVVCCIPQRLMHDVNRFCDTAGLLAQVLTPKRRRSRKRPRPPCDASPSSSRSSQGPASSLGRPMQRLPSLQRHIDRLAADPAIS